MNARGYQCFVKWVIIRNVPRQAIFLLLLRLDTARELYLSFFFIFSSRTPNRTNAGSEDVRGIEKGYRLYEWCKFQGHGTQKKNVSR